MHLKGTTIALNRVKCMFILTETENGLNLLDVDGDGREDLVFSVGVTKIMGAATDAATNIPQSSYKFYKTMHEICAIIGRSRYCTA